MECINVVWCGNKKVTGEKDGEATRSESVDFRRKIGRDRNYREVVEIQR